ncbi:MAG: exodeoxyribonuclease VII large subunit, partial [Chloroflexi bacterium]
PSAAAEMAVPDRMELQAALEKLRRRLVVAMEKRVERQRWALAEQQRALKHLAPDVRIATARQRVDDLLLRAGDHLLHRLALRRERLSGLVARLESLSPLATLERGYAIVRHAETGQIVRRVGDVASGDPLQVRVQDGTFEARVA